MLNIKPLWLIGIICALKVSVSLAESHQYSGVNNIQFNASGFDNAFAGNGFLLKHSDRLFGVTVKHTLFEAKTDKMTHVVINKYLKSWRVHPMGQPENAVEFSQLLNENDDEALNMDILNRDWLLFSLGSNKSALQPVELRTTPLQKGDTVTAYGCSYAAAQECQQDSYKGTFLGYAEHNLRVNLDNMDMTKLRGLSGSPVLDSEGKLVGIVSNVLPSESGEGFDFAPARIDYLQSILQ